MKLWQIIAQWYSLYDWKGRPVAHDPHTWNLPKATS